MSSCGRRTFVIGVGMTKFERPMTKKWDYPDMGRIAGKAALVDAGIDYGLLESVVASYCYGEPTCGQKTVYEIGLTGIPVFNVNNNCSSGSSALMLARKLVQSGQECVMALGFEKMERGLSERYNDKVSPIERHMDHMVALGAEPNLIGDGYTKITSDVIKLFAYAAREYMQRYPQTKFDDFVKISYKNRRHGSHNPYAMFQSTVSMDTIAKKTLLCYPINLGMCAMTADGGAAAIVCSEDFVRDHGLQHKAIEIIAQHMVTDLPSSFGHSLMDLSGFSMAQKAALACYRDSGLTPHDVDVLEVHDCFSCNELFMYEALQLVPPGGATDLLKKAKWVQNKSGNHVCKLDRWVVNPSGGLESKGHPIGATGLGQCSELVWQLRGTAGPRQVDGAKVGLQHNFGIGGAAVVTMYRAYDEAATSSKL